MTNFEKTIRRNVTKEHFINIINKQYGDGKNTFDYKYGDVSSWFTWARDNQGKFLLYRIFDKYFIDFNEKEWVENNKIFGETQPDIENIIKKLTTDILFVGLNISETGKPPESWPPFTNTRHHKNLVKLFLDTEAEGAYFTDIIKPDERIIKEITKRSKTMSDGNEIRKIVEEKSEILKEHFDIFKEELKFIGAEKPLLIVFGSVARGIMEIGFKKYLNKEQFQKDIIYIPHYQPRIGGFKAFAKDASDKVKTYLTIPYDEETIIKKLEKYRLPTKKTNGTVTPPPPPLGDEELNKMRDKFMKKGYSFRDLDEDEPYRCSDMHDTKNGGKVGFCIAYMRNNETKKGEKIWQILWENFNINGIYKPSMNEFIEKKKEIEEKFKYNCYILDYPVKNFMGKPKIKLWIIADQNDPLNSLLEIVQNTKEIIGY